MLENVLLLSVYLFLMVYGAKSVKAGINKTRRSYWLMPGTGQPKEKSIPFKNILAGTVSLICGFIGLAVMIFRLVGVQH